MKTLIVLPLLLLFAGSAGGQNLLDVVYEGPGGMVPADLRSGNLDHSAGTMRGIRACIVYSTCLLSQDVNQDGTPDLIFRNGRDLVIAIFDDTGSPQVRRIEDVPTKLGLGATAQFRGTANLDGDEVSEFLFEDEGDIYVFGIQISVGELGLKWRLSDVSDSKGTLLAVADFTNDGFDDLLIGVVFDDDGRVIIDRLQVWTDQRPLGAR